MGTFECHDSCPDLCKESLPAESLFSLAQLYGLTSEEKALAAKEPANTLQAYLLSWQAERLCMRLYRASRTNDESDACRHFVWASLLTRDLGQEFANKVLNAHEQEPREPERERAMDLANNRQGQLSFQSVKAKQGDDDIVKSFQGELKRGNLVILTPRPANKRGP